MHEFHLCIDQGRLVGTPQQFVAIVVDAGIGQRDAAVCFGVEDTIGVSCERSACMTERKLDGQSPLEQVAFDALLEVE
jgi:hypothetical protein